MKNIITFITILALCSCSENTSNSDTKNDYEGEKELDTTKEIKIQLNTYKTIEEYGTILSESELIRIFGVENIKTDTIWYGEGGSYSIGSVLTNPIDSIQLTYVWNDENDLNIKELDYLEVKHVLIKSKSEIIKKQTIHSEEGLYTGMNITELELWNEAPIMFNGFGWDYSGLVSPNTKGKIELGHIDVVLDLICKESNSCKGLLGDVILKSDSKLIVNAPIFVNILLYHPI